MQKWKIVASVSDLLQSNSLEMKESKMYDIKIIPKEDINFVWIGGSYISSLKAFDKI